MASFYKVWLGGSAQSSSQTTCSARFFLCSFELVAACVFKLSHEPPTLKLVSPAPCPCPSLSITTFLVLLHSLKINWLLCLSAADSRGCPHPYLLSSFSFPPSHLLPSPIHFVLFNGANRQIYVKSRNALKQFWPRSPDYLVLPSGITEKFSGQPTPPQWKELSVQSARRIRGHSVVPGRRKSAQEGSWVCAT